MGPMSLIVLIKKGIGRSKILEKLMFAILEVPVFFYPADGGLKKIWPTYYYEVNLV